MSSNRDLQNEMSRFEEELSKLTAATIASKPVYSAPPATLTSKPKINIQLSSFGSQHQLTSNIPLPGSYNQPPLPPQPPPLPTSRPPQPPMPPPSSKASFHPPLPQSMPMKRDSSGNLISNKTAMGAAGSNSGSSGGGPSTSYGAKKQNTSQGNNSTQQMAYQPAGSQQPVAAGPVKKQKKLIRAGGGQVWEDETLAEWDPDDFRLFVGDLGNEVTDEALARAFSKYTTLQKARVVRDKRSGKTKGFGFVSFKGSEDFIKAMREMNGKYIGNRPIKLRKSNWQDRNIDMVKKKDAEKKKMGFR